MNNNDLSEQFSEQEQEEQEEQEERPPRSPAEWISFSIALLILTSVVGLVGYQWITQKHEPAVLSVIRNKESQRSPGQFYVPFSVTNTGGETAELVQVIAELRINGKVEETGEQQIDFLSSGETEEGAFVFSRNPSEGEVVVRVASYKLP